MSNFALLSTGNPKIIKGQKKGYLTFILHLAPADLSGYNVCPMATAGCKAACLNTAGRGGMFKAGEITNRIQEARKRKARWFFEDRASFMHTLVKDIDKALSYARQRNLIPVFRLNGTSDLRWEKIPADIEGRTIIALYPDVQFYDYTKIANRKDLPPNYHLTFSLAENNELQAYAALKNGMNVAAVFRTAQLPETYMHRPVVNGDETDLRFLDPKGVIVGLKAKGRAKKDTTGFVKDIQAAATVAA